MTKQSKPGRTRPLDRDGDGRDGGSLPGNQTAPYTQDAETNTAPADAASAVTDRPAEYYARVIQLPHDTPLFGVDTNVPGLVIETADAASAFDLAQDLGRDLLADVGEEAKTFAVTPLEDAASADAIAGQIRPMADDHRHEPSAAEALADQMAQANAALDAEAADDLADARTTPGDGADKLEAIEREVDEANAAAEPDPADTFTAEEIAAGQTPVIEAEGEAVAQAADTATTLDPDDPIVTAPRLDPHRQQVAVRVRELQELIDNRRLYKTDQGYSATYGAPFIPEETVRAWIEAGLAEDVPTAGNDGGVRVTAEARSLLARHRQGEAA